MLECAYWAQDQVSFQRAEEKIKRTLHISIDDDTIRKAAGYIGKRFSRRTAAKQMRHGQSSVKGLWFQSRKEKRVYFI